MNTLDWLFIGMLSFAVLFLIFALLLLLSGLMTNKRLQQASQVKRPKNAKRRKLLAKRLRQLKQQRKHQFVLAILLLGLTAVGGGSAYYCRYYQQTHLEAKESEAVVQGYYILEELDSYLAQADQLDNPVKAAKNMTDLSSRLASFGARYPSHRLSEEGQRLLTRLYKNMSEVGLNMNNSKPETYLDQPQIVAGFREDIERTRDNQQKVFEYFRIDEAALKANFQPAGE